MSEKYPLITEEQLKRLRKSGGIVTIRSWQLDRDSEKTSIIQLNDSVHSEEYTLPEGTLLPPYVVLSSVDDGMIAAQTLRILGSAGMEDEM